MSLIELKVGKGWESYLRVAQRKVAGVTERLRPAISVTLRREAEIMAGAMRERFDKVRPANSRITKFLKGSSKPLVGETGDLRNAIGVVDVDETTFYIGIPEDVDEAKLAMIHEKGLTIVQHMTDKQRKFLHAVLPKQTKREQLVSQGKRKLREESGQQSTGIIVIHIPARPFIEPTFRSQMRLSNKRFSEALLSELGL